MKKVCVVLMVLLAVALTGAYAAEKEYKGYLSDVLCGTNGKDPAGNDLLKNPDKHALACMKAEACAASGYGIFLKGKDGMYAFYKFDAKGSEMAKKNIVDVAKNKDNIKISVKGELQADGTMMVKSLKLLKS
jgi:hypothetical protein